MRASRSSVTLTPPSAAATSRSRICFSGSNPSQAKVLDVARARAPTRAPDPRSRVATIRMPWPSARSATASNAVAQTGDLVVDQVHRHRHDPAALGHREPDRAERGQAARRLAHVARDLLRRLLVGAVEVDVERHERLAGSDRRRPGPPDPVRSEVGQPLAAGDRVAQALELALADLARATPGPATAPPGRTGRRGRRASPRASRPKSRASTTQSSIVDAAHRHERDHVGRAHPRVTAVMRRTCRSARPPSAAPAIALARTASGVPSTVVSSRLWSGSASA